MLGLSALVLQFSASAKGKVRRHNKKTVYCSSVILGKYIGNGTGSMKFRVCYTMFGDVSKILDQSSDL